MPSGCRFAGARVPYPRLALISFMGYAIGHNVGLNTLSGGAIRLRAYSVLGLPTKQIATVVAFGTLTFCLGAAALLGLSLVAAGAARPASVLHLHPYIIIAGACLLLAGVLAYLVLACSRHEPLRWRKFCDSGSEPRHRLRANRGGVRRPAVRRGRAVFAAAAAGARRIRGLRRDVHHRHRRRHHQQRAGRHRRVRIGAGAAVPHRAPRSIARLAPCLPHHLLFRAVRRGAVLAGRARALDASRAHGAHRASSRAPGSAP